MKIAALNKLTLLDYPGKMACIVFTDGCNLACPYCHNSALISGTAPLITKAEVLDFLVKRKNMLEGVVISGGEPLLHDGIFEFLTEIKALGLLVKLDTNGTFPEKLSLLIQKNLVDYVALDIKNDWDSYAKTVGGAQISTLVRQTADILISSKIDFEIRTTVTNELHSAHSIAAIAKEFSSVKNFFLQTFKASEGVLSENITSPSEEKMQEFLTAARQFNPNTQLR